jgi:hypothetical protein
LINIRRKWKKKEKEEKEGDKRELMEGVKLVRAYHMHIRKCHDETPYDVQCNINQYRKRKVSETR